MRTATGFCSSCEMVGEAVDGMGEGLSVVLTSPIVPHMSMPVCAEFTA